MCSLQLLHHSDVPRPVWGIFSLWEPAGGRERESRCVNIPKRCVNRGLGWHDLPPGQDARLAPHTAVRGVHCWLWEHSCSMRVSHVKLKPTRLKCNLPGKTELEYHRVRQYQIVRVYLESTVPYCSTSHRMPPEKETASKCYCLTWSHLCKASLKSNFWMPFIRLNGNCSHNFHSWTSLR